MSPSAAGIVESSDNQRVIPVSLRPDGTVRKERKVRPGFTPAEDVTRFRSSRMRAAEESERNRTVPGSGGRSLPGGTTSRSIPGAAPKPSTVAEKKKDQKEAPDAWDDEVPVKKAASSVVASAAKPTTPLASIAPKKQAASAAVKDTSSPALESPAAAAAAAAEQDPVKRQKALAKKIRAAEALRQKERDGEALLPEQKEKVDSIEALEKELKAMGI